MPTTGSLDSSTNASSGARRGKTRYDLEERLLEYSASIVRLSEHIHRTPAGNHVRGQIIRSGTSPLFNHGEAEGAESAKDFIHKLGVCLKELKETRRALLLIQKVPLVESQDVVSPILQETNELILIFSTSIRTTRERHLEEESGLYVFDEIGQKRTDREA